MENKDFAEMRVNKKKIEKFCNENGIKKIGKQYMFTLNGITYIVSWYCITIREGKRNTITYFGEADKRQHKYRFIRATQKDLQRIYEDLKKGIVLDDYGKRVDG